MKNFKFQVKKEKVLISGGCSHTQGTAYVKKIMQPQIIDGKEVYEMSTGELKKKYKQNYVTGKYISENLTWGGMLAKLLRVDVFHNFGFGGLGIEAVIRAFKNYSYRVEDLTNHLFVMQVPSPVRKEAIMLYKGKKIRESVSNIAKSANGDKFGFVGPDESKINFINNFFDFEISEIEQLYDLFYLQNYLEARGASIRFLESPFTAFKIKDTKQVSKYKHTLKDYNTVPFDNKLIKELNFETMFNKLNILNTVDLQSYRKKHMKDQFKWTLHSDGTFINDWHYNEQGNMALANCIKDNLNKKCEDLILENIIEIDGKKVKGESLI